MKWFKFIIYFQLFAVAAGSFISTITIMSSDVNEYLGRYSDSYNSLITFYTICMFALGIGAFVVRSRLANFCKNGPALYIGFILANEVVSIIYAICLSSILENLHIEIDLTLEWIAILTNVVMAVVNYVYFNDRKYLFNN